MQKTARQNWRMHAPEWRHVLGVAAAEALFEKYEIAALEPETVMASRAVDVGGCRRHCPGGVARRGVVYTSDPADLARLRWYFPTVRVLDV